MSHLRNFDKGKMKHLPMYKQDEKYVGYSYVWKTNGSKVQKWINSVGVDDYATIQFVGREIKIVLYNDGTIVYR